MNQKISESETRQSYENKRYYEVESCPHSEFTDIFLSENKDEYIATNAVIDLEDCR